MTKKKISITILACLVAFSLHAQLVVNRMLPAQVAIDKLQRQHEVFYEANIFSAPDDRFEEGIGPYTALEIDKGALKELFASDYKSMRLMIPLAGKNPVVLLLTQHTIHSEDFVFTVTDQNGRREQKMNEGRYYKGTIEGVPASMAAVSVFENEIYGIISDEEGNWNLGKKKDDQDTYVYFNDRTFRLPVEFSCETADEDPSVNRNINGTVAPFGTQVLGNCAKIFFDCSYTYYQSAGNSTSNVTNYTNSIFNVMNTIYGNDSIAIAISAINVWTAADPFNYASNGDALSSFKDYYNTNGFSGNMAALLSTQDTLGGGVAYVDATCSAYSYAFNRIDYAGVNAYPTYSWDVFLVSHECGHTLGSPHTHWCGWNGGPLDGCNTCWGISTDGGCASNPVQPANGGTIMSYCHGCSVGINFANGFSYQPANKIRTALAAKSCINVCTSCNTSLSLSGTHFTGENQSWWATNSITGSNIVQEVNSYLNFNAGVSVLLLPNVEIRSGSEFHASVGCTPLTTPPPGPLANYSTLRTLKASVLGNELVVYPNPFNSQIKAAFELSGVSGVSLSLFDQVGKLILPVQSVAQMDKGRHEVLINTEALPSGMYYLIVIVNGEKLTRKVVKM